MRVVRSFACTRWHKPTRNHRGRRRGSWLRCCWSCCCWNDGRFLDYWWSCCRRCSRWSCRGLWRSRRTGMKNSSTGRSSSGEGCWLHNSGNGNFGNGLRFAREVWQNCGRWFSGGFSRDLLLNLVNFEIDDVTVTQLSLVVLDATWTGRISNKKEEFKTGRISKMRWRLA